MTGPTCRRWILALALATVALTASPAGAYQHFAEEVADGVAPDRWPSLPIALTLDNGPKDISAEIATAIGTWNAVPTARNPWGAVTKAVDGSGNPVDFNATNLGTAWGDLSGDGRQEVVVDESGAAIRALGLAPASTNGYGPSNTFANAGHGVINDMYLIVNGQRTDF